MRVVLAILAIALASLLGLWAATEYVAGNLPPAIVAGEALGKWGAVPLYPPWAWLSWQQQCAHGAIAGHLFDKAGLITMLGAAFGVIGAAGAKALGGGASSNASDAHGSARWAKKRELRAAGLLRDAGVVLCQTDEARYETRVDRSGQTRVVAKRHGDLLRHDGPEHVICFAPTGSGKGVGLVVPTLLTWPGSVLVYDIKRENWALTAGFRRTFSHVWRFEPTEMDSLRFNPLLEIRKGLHEVKDAQNVADMLVDPTGAKDTRDHWQTTAHSLLVGAILHVLYAEADKTLSGVALFLSSPDLGEKETLERMLTTRHLPEGPHPVVVQAAREMLNKADRERSGVYSTAVACLGLYRDPVIARATSTSDFRIADLVGAPAPVSLYLVVPPSDLVRTRPLIRLMLNQIGRRLTETLGGASKHRLLLVLDEFPQLGRLDFFEAALAFIRGYGIKAFLVVQSLNQLEHAYGPSHSILDNCHVRLTYASNHDGTARRISELLGQSTRVRKQKGRSGSGLILSNRSESEQEFGRPLLTPGEVMQLPPDDCILLVGGVPPYRGRKVRYFLDPRLRDRARIPAPDDPREQAAELLPRRPSEWDGLKVGVEADSIAAAAVSSASPSQGTASAAGRAVPEAVTDGGRLAAADGAARDAGKAQWQALLAEAKGRQDGEGGRG